MIRRWARRTAGMLAVGLLSACTASGGAPGSGPSAAAGARVYLVPAPIQSSAQSLVQAGLTQALQETGGTLTTGTVEAATAAKAQAVVVAAGATAPCVQLGRAAHAGTAVVALGADLDCPGLRHLFVEPSDPASDAAAEVDLLAHQLDGSGQIAVLAGTRSTSTAWLADVRRRLAGYPRLQVVATGYGSDDPTVALDVLTGLLVAHPGVTGLLAPTSVGTTAAAQYLSAHPDAHLGVTGSGLPSQLRRYVKAGVISEFELDDSSKLGYLAGYAAGALVSGTVSLRTASTFTAGALGRYRIAAPAGADGPTLGLGAPTTIDAENIDRFAF